MPILDDYFGEILLRRLFSLIEKESGQSFSSLRVECENANRFEGRYPKELREKIARVRRVIEGMDGYEQITCGYPTASGYRLNNYRGLNLPWEIRFEVKEIVWEYLKIDKDKDKDSIGMSVWKTFYEGMFWSSHRRL